MDIESSQIIRNEIFKSIHLIADAKLRATDYSSYLISAISYIDASDPYHYKVKYQGNDIDVYSIGGQIYKLNDSVIVLYSNLDFSKKKIILSSSTNTGSSSFKLSFVDGSTSSPSINNIDNKTTGIYFPAGDNIGFVEGGNEIIRINSDGKILIGNTIGFTTRATATDFLPILNIQGTSAANSSILLSRFSNDANSSFLTFAKSRGTSVGVTTIVQASDILGAISFGGADGGAGIIEGAQIRATVDNFAGAAPALNGMPTRLSFFVTAASSSTPTERLRITQDGSFIINPGSLTQLGGSPAGNTLPRFAVIDSTTNLSYNINPNTTGFFARGGTNQISIVGGNANTSSIFFGNTTSESSGIIRYYNPTNTTATHAMDFFTNATARVRIDSSGNLLVGGASYTTPPGSLGNAFTYSRQGFTALNDTTILPYFQTYNSNAGTDLKTWRHGGDSSGNYEFQTVNDAYTAAVNRLQINSSGVMMLSNQTTAYTTSTNVTPLLQILSSTSTHQYFQKTGADANPAAIYFTKTRTTGGGAYTTALNADDQIAAILAEGSNGTALQRAASIRMYASAAFTSGGSPGYITLQTTPTGSTTETERMRVYASGDIAITATTTSSAANMFIDTTSSATQTAIIRRSTSSRRYKTNIRDYDKGIEVLQKMRPVYFNGIGDGDKQFAGFIAEEVHDIELVEFVQYNENNEPESLAYQNMVALLTKAIQEQQQEIESLKLQINDILNKL